MINKLLPRKSKTMNYHQQQIWTGTLFILPAIILLLIFLILPAVLSGWYSLQSYNILRPEATRFIGIENYIIILKSTDFRQTFFNTLYFTIMVVPIQSIIALGLAMLINRKTKLKSIFRIGFFSPVITSLVVVSILWTILYSSNGPINALLGSIGIGPQPFLASKNQAMNSIILMSVWQSAGYFMMIFLAGLQDIPQEHYEAADCDGANAVQKFFYVTIPGLKNVINFVIITTTIQAFKLFNQPYIMTKGGPENSTRTLVQLIYEEGFQYRNAGYASAITVIFFILILIISLAINRLTNNEK